MVGEIGSDGLRRLVGVGGGGKRERKGSERVLGMGLEEEIVGDDNGEGIVGVRKKKNLPTRSSFC